MEIYTCQYCNKKYKRKNYYNNHILNCRIHKICKNPPKIYNIPSQTQSKKSTIIHDTTDTENCSETEIVRENQGVTQQVTDVDSIEFDKMTITNENLFKLLINLTNKYEKLQNDYNELKKFTNYNKNKLNVIDHLNNNFQCNIFDYNDFCKKLSHDFNINDLEFVFKNDYVNGCAQIIINLIEKIKFENIHNLPIYAFNHKDGILYIYDKSLSSWTQINENYLTILIKELNKNLLNNFLQWKNNNEKYFLDEQFSEIYILNMKKIIGNNFDKKNKDIMIKNIIYKHIKVCIKNIFEIA